jgi:hypothetical protein
MEQVACLICKKLSHNESNCPELVEPLKNGFYTGEHGGGDEEDDD